MYLSDVCTYCCLMILCYFKGSMGNQIQLNFKRENYPTTITTTSTTTTTTSVSNTITLTDTTITSRTGIKQNVTQEPW